MARSTTMFGLSNPDGVNWTQETSAAQWGARTAFALFSFNNGMYVCGGSEAAATQDDVWYSSDGVTWSEVTNAASFWAKEAQWGFRRLQTKCGLLEGITLVALHWLLFTTHRTGPHGLRQLQSRRKSAASVC